MEGEVIDLKIARWSALKIEGGTTSQGMQVASKRNRYIQKKQILGFPLWCRG